MSTTLAEAADAWYAAGNKLLAGDPHAFDIIYSKQRNDISHLGPTGALCTGREEVMTQFAKESGMGFEGTLIGDERKYVEGTDMGYMVCIERTSGMTKDGEEIKCDIRATTIFVKEDDGLWRVVHHHTDRF